MDRKTKIVATVSSFNCDPAFIARLQAAGVSVVRLNTAHMSHSDALVVIKAVRSVADTIGILLDTKGPEIRTVEMDEPLAVKSGDRIRLRGAPGHKSAGDLINVSYAEFVRDVPIGSSIMIDDGSIALVVIDKDEEHLYCQVENDGLIRGKKSVNIPSVHVTLPALSDKDKAFIRFAAENDVDFIAHSFVRNKEDVIAVQEILDEKCSDMKIIAKIENYDGVRNLDEILDYAYGVMIARGDLAVEIPTEQIPLIQKKIIKTCIDRRRPVIVATQMLHSMIDAPRPTRAEVSDVANACLDHADALMLSGETANGKYPELAVRTMAKIINEVEDKHNSFSDVPYSDENRVTAYLAKAAVKAALRLGTKAIVADSVTGKSILALSAYRGNNPIFALVYNKRVMRLLSLSYGVYAHYRPLDENATEQLRDEICHLLGDRKFADDDLIIVLAGNFGPEHGASYIEIAAAGNLMQKCTLNR
jgi:pyruvate kinase